ncbi:MAG: tyrosine-protein phosphatase [Alphaproteobacteria bacterium]|nr:tyrosine-protein phosphatase [Alphaproteobacteria bacterium]
MRNLGDVLYNFHWVVPGEAARMAQPWAGFYRAYLARRGIRAIINLRGRNDDLSWWKSETAAAAALGAVHFDTMLDSRKLPTRDMLVQVMQALTTAPHPFVVKCSGGQDRTSLAMALYLIARDGWSALPAARRQFSCWPYLHFPKKHQRWLAKFLDFAVEAANGTPISAWIASDYTPEKLQAWLDDRGMGDFYAAIFTVPTRSPFQW